MLCLAAQGEEVFVAPVSQQRLGDLGFALLAAVVAVAGEHLGVARSRHDGVGDREAGDPGDFGDGMVQLHVHLTGDRSVPISLTRANLPPIVCLAVEIADPITSVLANKSSDLWTISPDATVFHAINEMSGHNVGALPVLDGDELAGIISERDYTRKVILKGKSSKDIAVRSIMSTELVTITGSDSVAKSLQTMTEKRVRHLPVVENGELAGIVTIGDLVKWIISAQDAMIDQLEGYIQGTYPA